MAAQRIMTQFAAHARQFAYGLSGGCTLISLAACNIASRGPGALVDGGGNPASASNLQLEMKRIYDDMRGKGWCAPNGGCRMQDIVDEAHAMQLRIAELIPYVNGVEPTTQDWPKFLKRNAGHKPMVMQVARGRNLVDARTGARDEAGLDYHAISILGVEWDDTNPNLGGYVCCDGDNPNSNNDFVVYPIWTLRQAIPISLVAFELDWSAPPPPPALTHWTLDQSEYAKIGADLTATVSAAQGVIAALTSALQVAQDAAAALATATKA